MTKNSNINWEQVRIDAAINIMNANPILMMIAFDFLPTAIEIK